MSDAQRRTSHPIAEAGSIGPLLLGVDTGGTYTDAVVYDERASRVVGSAKAPTQHDDLAVGIASAIEAALDDAAVTGGQIALASLSTTLATNALVEGTGRPAGLVAIGFDHAELARSGLPEALGDDPLIRIDGGHDSHGIERTPVDLAALRVALSDANAWRDVDAFAVTGQFSVRNPSHELAARDLVAEITGLPVTCSHELSAQLNGPKRAVTALLNARLISLTAALTNTLAEVLRARGINAPIMAVRGDGSLVSLDFVRNRPIETILSGPAASLVGAMALARTDEALVADIGGTTTDLAFVRAGRPRRGGSGAVVGQHRTMVDAVDMTTAGLGGDSEVHASDSSRRIRLGPRRVTPLSDAATVWPSVLTTLRQQLHAATPRDEDARLVVPAGHLRPASVEPRDREVAESLLDVSGDQPVGWTHVARSARDRGSLQRLVARGLARVVSFTPTDAAVALGLHSGLADIDQAVEAAGVGAELFARRRDRFGNPLAVDGAAFAELVLAQLARQSAELCLDVSLSEDGLAAASDSGRDWLSAAALDRREAIADWSPLTSEETADGQMPTTTVDIGVALPIVAVGASAHLHYPRVVELLGTSCIVPEHAEVANAVGAVTGRVTLTEHAVVSAPRRGLYRIHLGDEPETFYDLALARKAAETALRAAVAAKMARAGAREDDVDVETIWEAESVEVDGRELFVEGRMTVTGTARPRLTG